MLPESAPCHTIAAYYYETVIEDRQAVTRAVTKNADDKERKHSLVRLLHMREALISKEGPLSEADQTQLELSLIRNELTRFETTLAALAKNGQINYDNIGSLPNISDMRYMARYTRTVIDKLKELLATVQKAGDNLPQSVSSAYMADVSRIEREIHRFQSDLAPSQLPLCESLVEEIKKVISEKM